MTPVPPFHADSRRRLKEIGWLSDERAVVPLQIIWSGPDPEGAVERVVDFVEAPSDIDLLDDPRLATRLAYLAGGSRELMRQLTLHPEWLSEPEPDNPLAISRSVLAEVAADDLAGLIDVEEGGRRLSAMADEVVARILAEESREGAPPLAVMAMGKWGGRELNYWSDIDLIFVFEGEAGDAPHANRVAAGVMRRLAGTEPGQAILNADAGLRPEGSRGALARSLPAYRSYYQRWAEPWEFQALLKVRHAAGDAGVGARFLELVGEILWPETIDPDAIRSLRGLKSRAEASARPSDLKRAPGGIRDIEFTVQMLQLVHGRFDSDLRATTTLTLIGALVEGGYVKPADAERLVHAYRWLRAVEHRVQLWELRQTHDLPSDEWNRTRLARAMGYRDDARRVAVEGFEADLVAQRSTVRRIHEDLYFRPILESLAASPTATLSREGAERRLHALGFRDIASAVTTFEALTTGLSRRSKLMQQMLPVILDWLADSPDPDLGLDQLRLVAANTADHSELISALHDQPEVGRRLALLLGSSRLLGAYVDRLPEFIPRLGDDQVIIQLRRQPALEERLRRRVESRGGDAQKVGTLRRFARRHLLRVAARDLLGMAEVEATMRDLSDGADAAVGVGASLAGGEEGFAIIAMGRWGGREMSYGSDLDLLFVFDESRHDVNSARAVAVGLREVLARPGPDGVAYEIDTDLRPEGRSGPLVRSLGSYRTYYQRWAETWELQALVKARPVGADLDFGARFIEMIAPYVWPDPLPGSVVADVRQMKARIEKERIPPGEDPDFHLKLGKGGLVDIEFLAQLMQIRHGGAVPEVRVTGTLEALEKLVRVGALDPGEGDDLAAAYRFCTHVRNRLFLQMGRPVNALPADPTEQWRLAMSLGYRRRGDLREDYRRVTRRARRIFEDRFY